jgi:uncharacterized integral membrane protein
MRAVYRRRHDILYRLGMTLQVLGAGVLAVLYPLENPFYSVGIMLFDSGVLVSAIYFRVWLSWIRSILFGAAVTGIFLQLAGLFAPPDTAGAVIICGIGLVCVGAAGMAGKEAYCFSYREGWLLMWAFPAVVITDLVAKENRTFNALAFSTIFLLLLSLVWKKLRQPLHATYSKQNCGPPAT